MGKVAAMALCRLGNQMFIAAAARTFAARTGREFIGLVISPATIRHSRR